MGADDRVAVTVVCAWPDRAVTAEVKVSPGTTVEQAVRASGVLDRIAVAQPLALGVFGRVVARDYIVRSGDRIEILRPLAHDPKETRRKLAAEGRSIGKPRQED